MHFTGIGGQKRKNNHHYLETFDILRRFTKTAIEIRNYAKCDKNSVFSSCVLIWTLIVCFSIYIWQSRWILFNAGFGENTVTFNSVVQYAKQTEHWLIEFLAKAAGLASELFLGRDSYDILSPAYFSGWW